MSSYCSRYGAEALVDGAVNYELTGIFVAGGSLAFFLAMLADIVRSYKKKKFSVSCFWVTLDSLSIAALGYTTQISSTVDPMPGLLDQIAKLTGILLVCVFMNHTMPSLGMMDRRSLLVNMLALLVLITSTFYTALIQLRYKLVDFFSSELRLYSISMLLIYAMLVSHSLAVPTMQRFLDSRYQTKHLQILATVREDEELCTERIERLLQKYWLMALTSSPDYALRLSGLPHLVGVLCLLLCINTATLFKAAVDLYLRGCYVGSRYRSFTIIAILLLQFAATFLSVLTSLPRAFSSFGEGFGKWRLLFRAEKMRLQVLVEWKKEPLDLGGNRAISGVVYFTKGKLVGVAIGLQKMATFLAKLCLLVFCAFGSFVLYPVGRLLGALVCICRGREDCSDAVVRSDEEDLSGFVLNLDGVEDDPKSIAKKWKDCPEVWIRCGKRNQPSRLFALLSTSFSGSNISCYKRELFLDRFHMMQLSDDEEVLRGCWSLHLMTVTCIVYAGFHNQKGRLKVVVEGVEEGFRYAKLVDKHLSKPANHALLAAVMVWEGFTHRRKWVDTRLDPFATRFGSLLEKLTELRRISCEDLELHKGNGVHAEWPLEAVAAKSMYCVTDAVVRRLEEEEEGEQCLEVLGEGLVVFLRTCLAGLPLAILRKCSSGGFGSREAQVRSAARLLGQTERIRELLRGMSDLESCGSTPQYHPVRVA